MAAPLLPLNTSSATGAKRLAKFLRIIPKKLQSTERRVRLQRLRAAVLPRKAELENRPRVVVVKAKRTLEKFALLMYVVAIR